MHRALAALAALLVSLVLVACGDDSDDSSSSSEDEVQVASFAFDGKEMTGPESLEAGAVRIEFTNSSDDEAGVTLVKYEGDHTPDEVVKAGNAWGDKGKALPDWVTFAGGSTPAGADKAAASVQQLEAGSYLGLDIESSKYVEIEVTGDGTGELPETTASIDAVEFSFEASGLKAGTNEVLFTNKGKEPHFVLAAPIKSGKTIDDVKKSLEEESGPPPIDEENTVSSGILEGGRSQVVELELQKGKYALVCFVPNRAGGPPHAFLGMDSEAAVQ